MGMADHNIPPQNSQELHARNPADTALWEVPGAGHCGAVSVAPAEFDRKVLGWFAEHANPTMRATGTQ
jgi:pimeloyl-ACP methyl ester carboxylesterase